MNCQRKVLKLRRTERKIEQVKKEEYWNHLSEDFIKKIKLEIAPLIQWIEAKDNSDALTFDNSIYRILYYNVIDDKDALV